MSNAALSDGRVQNRIENYNAFWKDDPSKEEEEDNKSRLDRYTDVVNGTSPLHPIPLLIFPCSHPLLSNAH